MMDSFGSAPGGKTRSNGVDKQKKLLTKPSSQGRPQPVVPRSIYRRRGGTSLGDAASRQESIPQTSRYVPCHIAKECGACPGINLPYAQQLDIKAEEFRRTVEDVELGPQLRIGSFEPSDSRLNYRTTIKLAVADESVDRGRRASSRPGASDAQKRWLNIGIYNPGSHDVFDIGMCAAQDKGLNGLVQSIRYALKDNRVPVHHQILDKRGGKSIPRVLVKGLRYIIARKSSLTGQCLVALVTSEPMTAKLKIVARQVKQRHPELAGVSMVLNASVGNAIVESEGLDGQSVLLGTDTVDEELAGVKLAIHPLSFCQVNPPVASRMYRRIWEIADIRPDETWLDLYCGLGAIGLGAASRAKQVIGVEENHVSLDQATVNAVRNGADNWSGACGSVETLLAPGASLRKSLEGQSVGVVSLNPSRKGCEKDALDAVARLAPRTIVYMSCSIKTLCRDLKILEGLGYKTRLVEGYDMFPGTPHFESLALLTKSAVPAESQPVS